MRHRTEVTTALPTAAVDSHRCFEYSRQKLFFDSISQSCIYRILLLSSACFAKIKVIEALHAVPKVLLRTYFRKLSAQLN